MQNYVRYGYQSWEVSAIVPNIISMAKFRVVVQYKFHSKIFDYGSMGERVRGLASHLPQISWNVFFPLSDIKGLYRGRDSLTSFNQKFRVGISDPFHVSKRDFFT